MTAQTFHLPYGTPTDVRDGVCDWLRNNGIDPHQVMGGYAIEIGDDTITVFMHRGNLHENLGPKRVSTLMSVPLPRELIDAIWDVEHRPEHHARLSKPGPRESRVITWDYREQPDLAALARAVNELSDDTLHITKVDTGSDQYAIVVSYGPMTPEDAHEAYRSDYEGDPE